MKDYSKMSDFEINKAVIAFSCAYVDGDIVQNPHHADGVSAGLYRAVGDYYEWFDYCNNPSDAWPIIVDNKIWIQPDMIGDGFWHCMDCNDDIHAKDKNPLRAAMIVYLMMKDREK